MKEKIGTALKKIEGNKRGEGRRWCNKEYREKKGKVRKELRKWRRVGRSREAYRKERGDYKKLCEEKKREEVEKWPKEVEEAKTENQVWKIVNRERKGKKRVNKTINMEEYFRGLIGGVE